MLDNTGLYLQRKPTGNHQIQSMGCRTHNLIIIIILSHNHTYITRVVTTCICLIYQLWELSIKCFLGQECCEEIIVSHNLIKVHQRECVKPMLQEECEIITGCSGLSKPELHDWDQQTAVSHVHLTPQHEPVPWLTHAAQRPPSNILINVMKTNRNTIQ